MKKTFLLGLLLMAILIVPFQSAVAENAPRTINYTGNLIDDNGYGINKSVDVTFRIFNSEMGGTQLWTETHNAVSVDAGYFALYLGEVNPLNLAFTEQYWIEAEVDGKSYGRVPFSTSPYSFQSFNAFRADTADVAKAVIDGVIEVSSLSAAAREVTGDVYGTYPELYIKPEAIINNIPDNSITEKQISDNFRAQPTGQAGGVLSGTYPNPYFADGAVTTPAIADDAVTYGKLQNAMGSYGTILVWDGANWMESTVNAMEVDGVIGNEVIEATNGLEIYDGIDGLGVRVMEEGITNEMLAGEIAGAKLAEGTVAWDRLDDESFVGKITNEMLFGEITGTKLADATVGFDKLADGTEMGQVMYWNGYEWVFTESAPEYGYVLKWTPGDATTPATLDYGMDQMTIPFAYEGGSLYNNASETMLDLVMTTEATENANAHGIRVQMTPEAGSALVLEGAGVHGDFISPIATMNYVHTDGSATFNEGALNVNSEIQTAISGGNSYGAKFKQTIMGDNQDFNTYGAVIENEMYDQNGGLNAGLVINAITTGGGADGVVMGLHVDAESNNSTLVNYGGVFEAEGGLMNFGVYATVNGTVVTDMANITPSVTNIALVAYADDTANELALYAHGNSEIEGTLLVEENLEVMGNGLIDDDFEVNGMTTLNGGLTITGDVNVDGNIAATGTVTGTNVLADNEIRLAAVEAGLAQEILDRIADVDAEEARALAAEALLQSNIDDEVARAMAAEAVLQANIDAEEARALAAEAVLQANIDAVAADLAQEILDRIADVDAEEARALAAEAALQAALDQEILDRIADVDTEEARAMAAEAALQAQIDAMAISFTSDEIIANNSLTSNGTLDVYGETQLMDYTAIFADLDVFGGSIFTDGDVTAAGDMAATNMVADMMGAAVAEFATSLTVGTNTLVADATAGTVGITADLTVEGMSAFTGTTTIGGIATDMFTVNIPADFNEATTIDNTLDVTGNTTVTGTFDVTGNTTVTGTVDVTGNTMITGTLGVTDLATFNSGIQLDAPVYAYVDGNPSAHAGFAGNVFVSRGAGNSPEWTNEIPELTVENLAATTDFAILDAPNSPVMEVSPTSGRFVQFGAPGAANQVTVEVNGSMTVDNLTALNVPFISIEDCEITNSLTMIGADIDLNMNNINNVAALDMDGNINMNNHDINNVRDIEATNVSISNEFQVGPSTSPVLFADGSANTLVVNGGADLDVRTTIKNTEGTNALVLDDAVEVTGNLAVQTTTTAAFVSTTDMATADMSSYTTFIYTGANPVSAIAAGTEGQIIYLLNNTGANLDVLGLATLADKQMTVLVYVGGNWYVR